MEKINLTERVRNEAVLRRAKGDRNILVALRERKDKYIRDNIRY